MENFWKVARIVVELVIYAFREGWAMIEMRRTVSPIRTLEMKKCNPNNFYKLSWFEMKVKCLFRIFDNLQVGLVEAVSSRDRAWLILSLFFALQVNS